VLAATAGKDQHHDRDDKAGQQNVLFHSFSLESCCVLPGSAEKRRKASASGFSIIPKFGNCKMKITKFR
jgi:hypothetical protein